MKIRPVGAELLHANGRTDRQTDTDRHDEANSRFSQVCKRASLTRNCAPSNATHKYQSVIKEATSQSPG